MSKFVWNDQLVASAVDMWNADVSASEIARRLGTTKGSVVGKMHRTPGAKAKPSPLGRKAASATPVEPIRTYGPTPFEQTRDDQCRYPLWPSSAKTGNVCGCRKVGKSSWCAEHLALVAVPVSNLRRHYIEREQRQAQVTLVAAE